MAELSNTLLAGELQAVAGVSESDPPAAHAWFGPRPVFLILVALCALVFVLRLQTYEEPLERDLATYAVIAHEMLGGRALYTELWDHKPPAIHVTYAVAELIAGYGHASIFVMNVAAALVTLVACYFAGSAIRGGWIGGVVAATVWAVASGDVDLHGNQPNTEAFLNACLASALAIFLRAEKHSLGYRGAVVAGILFALASLYKPVAVIQAAFLGCAYIAWPPSGSRKKAIVEIAIIAAVGAAAWLLVFTYFFTQGRGEAFIQAVFTYNSFYSGSIVNNLSEGLSVPPISPDGLAVLFSLAVLSAAGGVVAGIFGPRRPWVLLLAFAVATHIAVLVPGWFFPHYYQLWLPPLAIGAGWSVALLKNILPGRLSWFSYVTAGVVCGALFILELPSYLTHADTWSLQKYGNIFLESDRLAKRIDKMLLPNETFYEWGGEPGLYFMTQRRPPSGILYAAPMLKGPLMLPISMRLIDDLEQAKPDLLVMERIIGAHTPAAHPVMKWFRKNYRPLSQNKKFLLFARNGSRLQAEQDAVPK